MFRILLSQSYSIWLFIDVSLFVKKNFPILLLSGLSLRLRFAFLGLDLSSDLALSTMIHHLPYHAWLIPWFWFMNFLTYSIHVTLVFLHFCLVWLPMQLKHDLFIPRYWILSFFPQAGRNCGICSINFIFTALAPFPTGQSSVESGCCFSFNGDCTSPYNLSHLTRSSSSMEYWLPLIC